MTELVGSEKPSLIRIVAILSILVGIIAIIAGILSVGLFTTIMDETDMTGFPVWSMQMLFYLIIGSGIATALQGWGLMKMKPWGWIMFVFFLLAMMFFSVHGYVSNANATSADLSAMIVSLLIAGLLLVYFVKKKDYFELDGLSTRTTLMIVGGLVTYRMVSLLVTEMAGTTIMEWLSGVILDEGVYSV